MGAEVSDVAVRHGQMVLRDFVEVALRAREGRTWGEKPGGEPQRPPVTPRGAEEQSSPVEYQCVFVLS